MLHSTRKRKYLACSGRIATGAFCSSRTYAAKKCPGKIGNKVWLFVAIPHSQNLTCSDGNVGCSANRWQMMMTWITVNSSGRCRWEPSRTPKGNPNASMSTYSTLTMTCSLSQQFLVTPGLSFSNSRWYTCNTQHLCLFVSLRKVLVLLNLLSGQRVLKQVIRIQKTTKYTYCMIGKREVKTVLIRSCCTQQQTTG